MGKLVHDRRRQNPGVDCSTTLEEYKKSPVLFIGWLGQRFGTPTDSYQSGTEKEFETAIRFRREPDDWPEIK